MAPDFDLLRKIVTDFSPLKLVFQRMVCPPAGFTAIVDIADQQVGIGPGIDKIDYGGCITAGIDKTPDIIVVKSVPLCLSLAYQQISFTA